jgi:dTDP-glucose pyrophosphorylase
MKMLKEFKQEIKKLGYSVKTHKGGINTTYIFLEVLQDKNFIVGSGGNVFTSEHINKHKKVFDLLNENRGLIFEENIKVLF